MEREVVIDDGYDESFDPVVLLKSIAFVAVIVLAFVSIALWASVHFHKDDAGVKEWKIWSERCAQITDLNADRLRESDGNTYFDGCPEGPHNEPINVRP